MSIIYGRNPAPKHVLPIEMNITLILILAISLIVEIVNYYVFSENIRLVQQYDNKTVRCITSLYMYQCINILVACCFYSARQKSKQHKLHFHFPTRQTTRHRA